MAVSSVSLLFLLCFITLVTALRTPPRYSFSLLIVGNTQILKFFTYILVFTSNLASNFSFLLNFCFNLVTKSLCFLFSIMAKYENGG